MFLRAAARRGRVAPGEGVDDLLMLVADQRQVHPESARLRKVEVGQFEIGQLPGADDRRMGHRVQLFVKLHVQPSISCCGLCRGGADRGDFPVDHLQPAQVGIATPYCSKFADQALYEGEHSVKIADFLDGGANDFAPDLRRDPDETVVLQPVQRGHDGLTADARFLADLLDGDRLSEAIASAEEARKYLLIDLIFLAEHGTMA